MDHLLHTTFHQMAEKYNSRRQMKLWKKLQNIINNHDSETFELQPRVPNNNETDTTPNITNNVCNEGTNGKCKIKISRDPHLKDTLVKIKITLPKKEKQPKDHPRDETLVPKQTNEGWNYINSENKDISSLNTKSPVEYRNIPIMGKNALLDKINRNSIQEEDNRDSEIIKEIVIDKFKGILEDHLKRSFSRQNSRNSKYGDVDVDNTIENFKDFTINDFLNGYQTDESSHHPKTEDTSGSATESPSIVSSNVSSFVSKTTNNSLQKSISTNISQGNLSLCEENRDDTYQKLVKHAHVQHQLMLQASKAIALCEITRGFSFGREQLEAERLLLLTSCGRKALTEEIRKIDFEGNVENSENVGRVTISNLVLPLRMESQRNDCGQWFVCVLHCNEKVVGTEVKMAGEEVVEFSSVFTFDNLEADFQINVSIYSMIYAKDVKYHSHQSKYLPKKNKCPKIFSKPGKDHSTLHMDARISSLIRADPQIRPHSFTLLGKSTIRISDLKKSKLQMYDTALFSVLSGKICLSTKSTVEFTTNNDGFMNIGTDVSGPIMWNRHWCLLEGPKLKYWNDQSEHEKGNPGNFIDLRMCATGFVETAPRSICAKKKTLCIEVFHARDEDEIRRYFLNPDSSEELIVWQQKINLVLSILHNWGLSYMKTRKID